MKIDFAFNAALFCLIFIPIQSVGQLNFSAQVSYPTASNPTYVGLGGFNGDGKMDFIDATAHSGRDIALSRGTFDSVLNFTASYAVRLALSDFDG